MRYVTECEKRAVSKSLVLEKTEYRIHRGEEVYEVHEVSLFIRRGSYLIVCLKTSRKLIVLFLESIFVNDHTFAIEDAPNKAPLGWN